MKIDWFESRPNVIRHSAALLCAALLLCYSNSFSGPMIFDDVSAIVENPTIRQWSSVLQPPTDTTVGGRPLLNVSFAANFALSGVEVWSYHAVNLLIHGLAALTLFALQRRTLASVLGKDAEIVAFLVTLIWALHPLHTESVTYIVQRAESLMGLCYLGTLYCFLRGCDATRPNDRSWFTLSALCCLLGMATKEVMVSAPLMVLFYDRTFLAGNFREAWRRRRWVYVALSTTWLFLLWLVFSHQGRGESAGFSNEVSFWDYVFTQFPAVLRYIKLSFWPHPLVFYYGTEWVEGWQEVWPSIVLVVTTVAGTAWAFFSPRRNLRFLGFAGIWFCALLAPTSLVPIVRQTAAEHRMYLPLIPLASLAVVVLWWRLGRAALPLCLTVGLIFSLLTWRRNRDYISDASIWADTVQKMPRNAYAHHNLAFAMEKEPGGLSTAIAHYEEAIRLDPDLFEAHTKLGKALAAAGRPVDALAAFQTAVRLMPGSSVAHTNLGNALQLAGGSENDAIRHFQEAVRLKPDFAEAHLSLGRALAASGQVEEAILGFERAIRLNPDFAEAHYNLANALNKIPGRTEDAILAYRTAIRLKRDFAEAHNNLGSALAAVGRGGEAVEEYWAAVHLRADYPEARKNLGIMLYRFGRIPEAVEQLEEALRLAPNSPEAHFELGNALAMSAARNADAIAHYEAALAINQEYLQARINLGLLLSRERRFDEAIVQLQRACLAASQSPIAFSSLGSVLAMGGRLSEAKTAYLRALSLKSDYGSAHFNLARVLSLLGGHDMEAISHYKRALQLHPAMVEAHYNLALLLLRSPGGVSEASTHLEEVLRIQPDHAASREMLSRMQALRP